MAQLVLGIGTSHGPLLSTPPDMWNLRAQWDRAQMHPYQGRLYSYDELRAARSGENLAAQITPEERRRRFDACQAAICACGTIGALKWFGVVRRISPISPCVPPHLSAPHPDDPRPSAGHRS